MPLYKCQDPDCEECQKAFGAKVPPASRPLPQTKCGCTDECLHKPDCVFENEERAANE